MGLIKKLIKKEKVVQLHTEHGLFYGVIKDYDDNMVLLERKEIHSQGMDFLEFKDLDKSEKFHKKIYLNLNIIKMIEIPKTGENDEEEFEQE